MNSPRVGLITFGDERPHEWEKVFKNLTVPRHDAAIAYFNTLPVQLFAASGVVRTKQEIDAQVDELKAAKVEVLVAHVPCWTGPNLVVRGIQGMDLPTVVLSNKSPATHGSVGMLGASGALAQIGFPHVRIREDFESTALAERIVPFFRAASAVRRLRGEVFGLFGGRSLGIDTGSIDPMQWRQLFGIDVEHIDQLEIIRRADQMPADPVEKTVGWLAENVGTIAYDSKVLTPEKLSYQVRCYLATQQVVDEMGLDFIAVKCMPDLANDYVPQCIAAALMPGPYDAFGKKEPFAYGCEADCDGALTMEVLKHISGGMPVLFGDFSYLNAETSTIYIPNCGAICTWFAGRSDDPRENLRQVELRPGIRRGGGAITYFKAAPGPLTLSRLYRKSGHYHMAIIPAEAVEPSREEYEAFVQARGRHQLPTVFARVSLDFEQLIDEYGSNHVSAVAGNYVEELRRFCDLLGIKPVVMGV